MKTLVLIRHAKTEPFRSADSDYHRALTQVGLEDALCTGRVLQYSHLFPDQLLCSSATRTRQTAAQIGTALNLEDGLIHYSDALYHATAEMLSSWVESTEDPIQCLFIIGHNNGISEYARSLFPALTYDLKPGAVLALQSDALDWYSFSEANKALRLFFNPRKSI